MCMYVQLESSSLLKIRDPGARSMFRNHSIFNGLSLKKIPLLLYEVVRREVMVVRVAEPCPVKRVSTASSSKKNRAHPATVENRQFLTCRGDLHRFFSGVVQIYSRFVVRSAYIFDIRRTDHVVVRPTHIYIVP